MKLLDSTIFLFENIIDESILKEFDTYFSEANANEHVYYNPLSDKTKFSLNRLIRDKIQERLFQYFIELNHPDRPDLMQSTMTANHMSLDLYSFNKDFRERNTINIRYATATMHTRASSATHFSQIKNAGDINNFIVIVGISRKEEHTSYLNFPIQQVKHQLNRGDVIVAPGGITHPFCVNGVINGKFKYIEGL